MRKDFMRDCVMNVKSQRKQGWVVAGLVAAVMGGGSFAMGAAHPDTMYTREMVRWQQSGLLKTAAANAKGKPEAYLFEGESVRANWFEYAKSRSKSTEQSALYVADLTKYLDTSPAGVDGTWALDQAKFIFASISEPVINRMELWSNNKLDRQKLAPMAKLADRMLTVAADRLKAEADGLSTNAARGRFASEEAYNDAYMKVVNAQGEVDYYRAWAQYFMALGMEPGDLTRGKMLKLAADTLGQWADGDADSGVKYQSLLLRGKVNSENSKIENAVKDLTGASNEAAPSWVQYQARYQIVVAWTRKLDFKQAGDSLATLRTWMGTLPEGREDAMTSADMLEYRVEWARAETMTGKDRDAARLKALSILSGVIGKNPKFKDLVFEQLAAQVGDSEDTAALPPMQALAVARSKAQSARDDSDASKELRLGAIKVAMAVHDNKAATASEVKEATLIAAVCSAQVGHLQDAVRLNLEYVEKDPGDKQSKELVELSLSQLGALRHDAHTTNTTLPPEVATLTLKALQLATGKYDEPQWYFALGGALEESGKATEAAAAYERVADKDANYLDARYRLVLLSVSKMNELAASHADAVDQKKAGINLLTQCDKYLKQLQTAPAEARERARGYMTNLRLVQASTAIDPLADGAAALKSLKTLEEEAAANNITLTTTVQGAVLRYRILAYQLLKQPGEAIKEVQALKAKFPHDAPDVIRRMVADNVAEIERVQKSDPEHASALASVVADLLQTLVDDAIAVDAHGKDVYSLRQAQAQMLAQSGRIDESKKLWSDLSNDKDHPNDLLNAMGLARAMYENKEYKDAAEAFRKILPKLTPGAESYWECWLRILQCYDATGSRREDVVKTLKDLQGSNGAQMGGTRFKDDFNHLMQKYGV